LDLKPLSLKKREGGVLLDETGPVLSTFVPSGSSGLLNRVPVSFSYNLLGLTQINPIDSIGCGSGSSDFLKRREGSPRPTGVRL
jgi:hypothetical protein